MRGMWQWFVVAALVMAGTASAAAAEENRTSEGVGLTIYTAAPRPGQPRQNYQQVWTGSRQVQVPQGYAVVKVWRRMDLTAGRNVVRFRDVAKLIEPSTVHFKSLTDPEGTFVVEQNYEYDLVNRDKLLDKYIDKPITLPPPPGENEPPVTGRLLSNEGGLVIDVGGKIVINPPQAGGIVLPELPGGLITRPTLVWLLQAAKAGAHLVKVTYQTNGILWLSDYTAVIKKNDTMLDLSGWVTIDNRTGATYDNAQLKLVAGDVNRVEQPGEAVQRFRSLEMAKGARPEGGFEEKGFFEYHLYTLGRPTTIKDNSQKQIELFPPVDNVPAQKTYLYFGATNVPFWGPAPQMDRNLGTQSNKKVDIYLSFVNSDKVRLGIPLPAGRVRVYKMDEADGSLEFIGEDQIDHTPKDEKVLLKMGSAFDVVGERKQTDFQINTDQKWMTETFEIKVRNHKKEAVEVIVKEVLFRWATWEITKNSHPFEKQDFRTIHVPVKIEPDGEATVTYTVRYTW
jgi:hypothetical protein